MAPGICLFSCHSMESVYFLGISAQRRGGNARVKWVTQEWYAVGHGSGPLLIESFIIGGACWKRCSQQKRKNQISRNAGLELNMCPNVNFIAGVWATFRKRPRVEEVKLGIWLPNSLHATV
jgi:hypothetical protein